MYTTAELRARVVVTLTLNNIFTDRLKAVLLLWFTISVTVCLCMYVLVEFLFWIIILANFLGNKLSFWLSACGVLIVVPML